jgi:hypothetical protein
MVPESEFISMKYLDCLTLRKSASDVLKLNVFQLSNIHNTLRQCSSTSSDALVHHNTKEFAERDSQ